MNYQESLQYLYERLPMFQRVGAQAFKKDLTNTIRLLEGLGNPHQKFKSIHIAGTNGKGSSAHSLAAILQCAGYKTGLYTSPHLKSFTERIRIDGQEVSEEFVGEFVTRIKSLIEAINPSFFEVTVAMAFEYFNRQQVDIAVIETGLGGRLDSTNVIDPELSLITMIGKDHADMLGNTLPEIASEKAGIIKTGKPIVIGANQPELRHVFEQKATQLNASFYLSNDIQVKQIGRNTTFQTFELSANGKVEVLKTDLIASYFLKNIPGVIRAVNVLQKKGWKVSDQAIEEGLAGVKKLTGLKGRWQVLGENPLLVADISHNEPGLAELFAQVRSLNPTQLHLAIGMVKDKDIASILNLFPRNAAFYFTQSSVPRSLPSDQLQDLAQSVGLKGESYSNVNMALSVAKKNATSSDMILICGSTFVVAEIEEL